MDEQQLWQGYSIECKSYIEEIETAFEAIEQVLETDGSFNGDVTIIFRSFHSLKGTSFGMGLESIAKLAHACEDILGLVRDHGASINNNIFGHLFNSLEQLTQMVEAAVEKQADVSGGDDLIDQLKNDFAALSAETGTAPQVVEEEANEDDEMMGIFCETAKEYLQTIFNALNSSDPAAQSEELEEALSILIDGTEMLQLEEIMSSLKELQDKISEPKEAFVFFQDNIVFQFELLFEIAEVEPLVLGSSETHTQRLLDIHKTLDEALIAIMIDGHPTRDINDIKNFLINNNHHLADISKVLQQLFMNGLSIKIDVINDLVFRYANGQMEVKEESSSLFSKINQIIALIAEGKDEDDTEVKHFIDELDSLLSFIMNRFSDSDEGQDIIDVFDIDEIYRSVLDDEQTKDILAKTKDGYILYGLEAFPDRDEILGNELLNWLKNSVQMVSNKTLFSAVETGFEFLLLSKIKADVLEKEIMVFDPKKKIIATLIIYPREQLAQIIDFTGNIETGKTSTTKARILRVPLKRIDDIMDIVQSVTRHLNIIEEAMGYLDSDMLNLKGEKTDDDDDIDVHKRQKYNRYLDALRTGKFSKLVLNEINLATNRMHNISEICSETRLMSLQQMLQRIPRSAKILAEKLGKKVSVTVESDPINVDNAVYEVLAESLTHLIRNAIDHGLEMPEERIHADKTDVGRIKITVESLGEELLISIIDDGRGIDYKKVRDKALSSGAITEEEARKMSKNDFARLILRPNFSTAQSISQVSGRGVGMGVVNNNIQFLGGSLGIYTELGKGSRFTLRIPLQSTMQRLVLFESCGVMFSLPEMFVSKIVYRGEDAEEWEHKKYARIENEYMPIISLKELFNLKDDIHDNNKKGREIAIVAKTSTRTGALVMDKIIGHRETFLQKSNSFFQRLPYIQKAAVVGPNQVPLVLDIFSILNDIRDEGL